MTPLPIQGNGEKENSPQVFEGTDARREVQGHGQAGGGVDGGILTMEPGDAKAAKALMAAVAKHRHPERESDPPLV